jgi:hypothetical protein
MKTYSKRKIIFISLIITILGFIWRPLARVILLTQVGYSSWGTAFRKVLYNFSDRSVFVPIPYYLLSILLLTVGFAKPHKNIRRAAIFGFIGASLPVMYVELSSQIYNLTPGSREGGYTGDAILAALAWFLSFVTMSIGFVLGMTQWRKSKALKSAKTQYIIFMIALCCFII